MSTPAPRPTARQAFARVAHHASDVVGSVWAFLAAIALVAVWAITGPVFGYSDTWQLVINTGTTIVTFLTVFLIQNTQNRDTKAMALKLDELIRAVHGARTRLVRLEDMSDEELTKLQHEFERLHERFTDAVEPAADDRSRPRERAS
jgi:low affinity Fe/Cu permease